MKRIIKVAFLVLISVISTSGIAFGRASEVGNCGTVSECLQNVVEADNKLVTENEKLMKETLELKKEIGELQSKFNCLVDLDSSVSNIFSEQSEEIPNIASYDGSHDHSTGYCKQSDSWGTCTYDMVIRNAQIEHAYMNRLANKINEIIKKIAVIEKTLKDFAKCK